MQNAFGAECRLFCFGMERSQKFNAAGVRFGTAFSNDDAISGIVAPTDALKSYSQHVITIEESRVKVKLTK